MTGYVGDIEAETEANDNFRRVLFTGEHTQLVVMSLRPGEDIGEEVHEGVDQFFRIEAGQARFVFSRTEEHLLEAGSAVVVPSGTLHNVLNASASRPLKLYTLYSPPQHPDGTVHTTKADALASEHH